MAHSRMLRRAQVMLRRVLGCQPDVRLFGPTMRARRHFLSEGGR